MKCLHLGEVLMSVTPKHKALGAPLKGQFQVFLSVFFIRVISRCYTFDDERLTCTVAPCL